MRIFQPVANPTAPDKDFPRRALGKQSGLDTDTFDLTFETPLKLVSNSNSEQLKLDARAARIHDENSFGHRSGPDRFFRAPAVSEQHGDSARSHACAYVIGARRQNDRAHVRRARYRPHRLSR